MLVYTLSRQSTSLSPRSDDPCTVGSSGPGVQTGVGSFLLLGLWGCMLGIIINTTIIRGLSPNSFGSWLFRLANLAVAYISCVLALVEKKFL